MHIQLRCILYNGEQDPILLHAHNKKNLTEKQLAVLRQMGESDPQKRKIRQQRESFYFFFIRL